MAADEASLDRRRRLAASAAAMPLQSLLALFLMLIAFFLALIGLGAAARPQPLTGPAPVLRLTTHFDDADRHAAAAIAALEAWRRALASATPASPLQRRELLIAIPAAGLFEDGAAPPRRDRLVLLGRMAQLLQAAPGLELLVAAPDSVLVAARLEAMDGALRRLDAPGAALVLGVAEHGADWVFRFRPRIAAPVIKAASP